MHMRQLLAAHKSTRIVFAVVTLAIAIAGVVTNFSLSARALAAFDHQLKLRDSDQFMVSGRYTDAQLASRGTHDGPALSGQIGPLVTALLPASVEVHQIAFRQSSIDTNAGPLPVRLVQASTRFLNTIGATPLPPVDWKNSSQICAIGAIASDRLSLNEGDDARLDGRICKLGARLNIPDAMPFMGLSDAIFVPRGVSEFATDVAVGWSLYLRAPAGTLSETQLRSSMSLIFNVEYFQIWSGATVAARAERLKTIVLLIANSLGFVILFVGAAAIGSLMSFSVSERAKEIAIKRTLGASKRQIVSEIMCEALLIGCMAILIGLILGYFLSQRMEEPLLEFMQLGSEQIGDLIVVPIVQTVALFLIISALAGAIPGWRASTEDPAVVLRKS
jgi:putative ABC transport system permease protein